MLHLSTAVGPPATDADLLELRGPRSLQIVNCYLSRVTDVGLAHLTCLEGLREVELYRSRVTDEGVLSEREYCLLGKRRSARMAD